MPVTDPEISVAPVVQVGLANSYIDVEKFILFALDGKKGTEPKIKEICDGVKKLSKSVLPDNPTFKALAIGIIRTNQGKRTRTRRILGGLLYSDTEIEYENLLV